METTITKRDWWDAGCAKKDIDIAEVCAALGQTITETVKGMSWEGFCSWVYKTLTGQELETPRYHGRGRCSRYYGEALAKVWPHGGPVPKEEFF